jgi:uncharacterized protein YjbI with pentapeptide repeats
VLRRSKRRLRKHSVVQFLYESDLITKDHIVVDLMGANLAAANLTEANLKGANLREAYLARANLMIAKLSEADLGDTELFGANLDRAELDGANLSEAVLMGDEGGIPMPGASLDPLTYTLGSDGPKNADLREADLTDAYVSEEQLRAAKSLKGATMPNGQMFEDCSRPGSGVLRHRRGHLFMTPQLYRKTALMSRYY